MSTVHGRLISAVQEDGQVALTINRGTNHGVAAGMKGELWRQGTLIDGSFFVIQAASNREAKAELALSIDLVASCDEVMVHDD